MTNVSNHEVLGLDHPCGMVVGVSVDHPGMGPESRLNRTLKLTRKAAQRIGDYAEARMIQRELDKRNRSGTADTYWK